MSCQLVFLVTATVLHKHEAAVRVAGDLIETCTYISESDRIVFRIITNGHGHHGSVERDREVEGRVGVGDCAEGPAPLRSVQSEEGAGDQRAEAPAGR